MRLRAGVLVLGLAAMTSPVASARIATRGAVEVTRRTAPASDWRLLLIDTTESGDLRGLGFGATPEVGERFAMGDTKGYLGVFEVREVRTRGCEGAHYHEVRGEMVGGATRESVGDRVAVGPVKGPMPSLRVEVGEAPEMGLDARPLVAVHLDADRRFDLAIFAVKCEPQPDGSGGTASGGGACVETRARRGKSWRRISYMPLRDCN